MHFSAFSLLLLSVKLSDTHGTLYTVYVLDGKGITVGSHACNITLVHVVISISETPEVFSIRTNLTMVIEAVARNLDSIVPHLRAEEEPFVTADQSSEITDHRSGMTSNQRAKKLVEDYILPKMEVDRGELWFEKLVRIFVKSTVEYQLVKDLIQTFSKNNNY